MRPRANYQVYCVESVLDQERRTRDLIADDAGDGWTAIYRRQGTWEGRIYPATIVGLTQADITTADLERVGDRPKGMPRAEYDQHVRLVLGLLDYTDRDAPGPSACVGRAYIPGHGFAKMSDG